MSTDDGGGGYMSCLADNTETVQLGVAAEMLRHALEVLSDEDAGPEELRLLTTDLARVLRDALRVAESRGRRLRIPERVSGGGDDEGPRLPAAAFG
ncbi:hypothetical protein [Streptomyces achmelvichensis]|uniref:hypothetical protein n=1 Tax=Streptomyces achmelvichensis TaxID=3134111 RepID=UPI003C12BE5C